MSKNFLSRAGADRIPLELQSSSFTDVANSPFLIVQIVISCRCKRRSIEVECGRRRKEDDEQAEHGAQSKDFLYELSCDEQCELEARNRNLAEALGISIPIEIQGPSDWLLDFARFHRKSVEKLERKFEKFLCGNSQKLAFPTSLDHIQRKLIHELANIYRCDSVSLDKEPFRNVVVTKRNDSRVPSVLLSVRVRQLETQ